MITTITIGLFISTLVLIFILPTGRKISPLESLMNHNRKQEQLHKEWWEKELIERYIRPRGEESTNV